MQLLVPNLNAEAIMTTRSKFWRTGLYAALIVSLAVLVAGWVLWLRLPSIIEWQVVNRLNGAGFDAPRLRVESVSLSRVEMADFQVASDPWRVKVNVVTAGYRLWDLLRSRLESLRLDGVDLEFDIRSSGTETGIGAMDVETWDRLARGLSARMPVRVLSVTNGLLRALRGEREVAIPFAVTLTNDVATGHLEFELRSRQLGSAVLVTGRVDPGTGARLVAAVENLDLNPWLEMAWSNGLPGALEGMESDPVTMSLELRSTTAQGGIEISGEMPRLRLLAASGGMELGATRYRARMRRDGTGDANIITVVREIRQDGLRGSVDTVLLDTTDFDTLRAKLENARIAGPHGMKAEGDVEWAMTQLGTWPDNPGTIDFLIHELEFEGVVAQPFTGSIRGVRNRFEVEISRLTLEHQKVGVLKIGEFRGLVTDMLGARAEAAVTGEVAIMAFTNAVVAQGVGFHVNARRADETMSGDLCLDFMDDPVHVLPLGEQARISGGVLASVTRRGDQTIWKAQIELELADTALPGLSVGRAKLMGEATSFEGNHAFDLELGASDLTLTNGIVVVEPRLRLRRPMLREKESDWVAGLDIEASSVTYQAIQMSNPRGAGDILTDTAWLKGAASVEGEAFEFSVGLHHVGTTLNDAAFTGSLALGTVRLRDYVIPSHLLRGKTARVTGDVDVHVDFERSSGGNYAMHSDVRFEFEAIEWSAPRIVAGGVRGEFAWGPPEQSEQRGRDPIRVEHLGYGDWEATDVTVEVEWVNRRTARVELTDASFLGGQVWTEPFLWNLENGEFETVVYLGQVSLEELAEKLPQFDGSVEGSLNGRLPVGLTAKGLELRGGWLELGRDRPARLRYAAEGLLTRRLGTGPERIRQLKLVEEGLKDLRLDALTVELNDPDAPETPVRLRLEGTFATAQAIVPVIFNMNVNGDLAQVLRLMRLKQLQPYVE
jgi:hypothetical protein